MHIKHLLLILIISGCPYTFTKRSLQRSRTIESRHTPCTHLQPGKVTVFIHGTVFPGISRILQHKDTRRGLYRYTASPHSRNSERQRLAQILHNASPDEFPANSFYKYYWSGDLSLDARKKAAEELFHILKDHTGPITLIAHSHGCNVALHLAEVEQHSSLQIDKLILLAPPVQETTASLVSAPLFKRVYSFYSTTDFLQVADPQGLHKETDLKETPLFSQRTYKRAQQVSQARILITGQSPSHRDFILPRFFKQLPKLLPLLDAAHQAGNQHSIVNIPYQGEAPHFLEHSQRYSPRRERHCTCRNKSYFEA